MTGAATEQVQAQPHRYRLSRAGVLNVWQYDEQVFDFADGRLLLRGANGAGKSKTLEMLLPFVLDGDKLRMTASGRHHTSLVWLMTDGYDGNRTGYLWVEFARCTPDGEEEVLTCGIGVRASSSAKSATTWYFTAPRRVGDDLLLEDDAGPLTAQRCREAVLPDGHFFEQGRAYKQHVGQTLFGLDVGQYDELLRLLYWLRQPQVGEDIEPGKLADQLSQALPQVDDDAVRAAGDTFDELAAFGEQISRRTRAAHGVRAFADVYADHARGTVRTAGLALVEAHRELGRRATEVAKADERVRGVEQELREAGDRETAAEERRRTALARERELEQSPEARSAREVLTLERQAHEADGAARRAEAGGRRAREQADTAQRRVSADAEQLHDDVVASAQEAADLVREGDRVGASVAVALPAGLTAPQLTAGEDAAALELSLVEQSEALQSLRPAVGRLLAAVEVVRAAQVEAAEAETRRRAADERAAEAERQAEAERGRREDAARAARDAEDRLTQALSAWQGYPRGVPFVLPELTSDGVRQLPSAAQDAADPQLQVHQADLTAAYTARLTAERERDRLSALRQDVEREPDPAPPAPAVERSPRDASEDGIPLWRLVDVTALAAPDDALLEAALQGAGLLDALVLPDGAVLDAERLDAVLPAGGPVQGRSLADVLRPDVPAGCPVDSATVLQVLRRVAVVASAPDGEATAAVDLSGGWRLGPLTGRARKPVRQYIGATARAAERRRRLDEIDGLLAVAEAERATAAAAESAAERQLAGLRSWLAAVPDGGPVLRAWTVLDERADVTRRAESAADAAESTAVATRAAAAALVRALQETAAQHGLPTDGDGLTSRALELRGVDDALKRYRDTVPPLQRRLQRWADDHATWRSADDHAVASEGDARTARREAAEAAARHRAVREAAGAGIAELERRLAATRSELHAAQRDLELVRPTIAALRERRGEATSMLTTTRDRHAEQAPAVVAASHALARLADVPGCLPSAGAEGEDVSAFELARGLALGDPVPAAALQLGRRLAALDEPQRAADASAVYAALQTAMSSDAADHEPRVVSVAGTLAALGRDDGGEHPVAELAGRLETAVLQDQALLTERERTLFEEHLVSDLGELLRRRRVEAEELVEGMNRLLRGVTTSQGIAVKLDWRLRDDVPDDARRAVVLLGRTVESLTATERSELRDALHRLIDAARAEAPEESYAEHLGRALDYRRWSAFRIRYTRPEHAGQWKELHRRSPLSQGEQKVVCYLPLFAAAAAHFTSLAGAAPHAPRFVLLDDAFPKIDVRTHPLLFGLLVDLDLDFVITSERLWGDHATVPSLAIYEALRDPAQRGVAQYRYTWDGARLTAVGA